MKGLKYVILITHREYAETYVDFFKSNGSAYVLSKFCEGTATDSLLNLLSLERKGKVMIETFVRETDCKNLLLELKNKTNLAYPGNGIAMILPTDALGGKSAKTYLAGEEPITPLEEEDMNATENKFCLIITIADKGNIDLIMDSARSAGATGGTVVKGKGTGVEQAKIFGINVAEEKDVVYIVTKRSQRDDVMTAIMQNAGVSTDAHGIVFSLPVDNVLGIAGLLDE